MKCPHCNTEIEKKNFIFKNLEFSPIQKHTKTFKKIKIPKGWRLPKVWELLEVIDSEGWKDLDKEYKKEYHWFFCEQTNFSKNNNYLSRVYLNRNGYVFSNFVNLANSGDYGRVIFVKDLNEVEDD